MMAMAPATAQAVDGISVTVHWQGQGSSGVCVSNCDELFWGGFGQIWRHEIRDSVVVNREMIYDGLARYAVLSPSGRQVGFIKPDGTVSVIGIKGGPVIDVGQAHPEGSLDWPVDDYLYYSTGGWEQYDTSRQLYRVNTRTGAEEHVTTWECGTWRFHVSHDLTRAVLRAVSGCNASGGIVAYDLATNDGTLPCLLDVVGDNQAENRCTDQPSCGEAFDPLGEFFADGMPSHQGLDIRRWDTLEIVKTFFHSSAYGQSGDIIAADWGGPDSGDNHNRNHWSVNSQNWLCMHLGWEAHHGTTCRGANQVLYDWINEERIVVTENTDNSFAFDSAGDFWVGVLENPPTVYAGADITASLEAGAELMGVVGHGDGVTVEWSQVDGPGIATFTQPTQAQTHVAFDTLGAYTLRLTATGAEHVVADDILVMVANNGAPSVDAGEDRSVLFGQSLVVEGTVTDDGLPDGVLTVAWNQVDGPGTAVFSHSAATRTVVTFSAIGRYALRLAADDGEHETADELTVDVGVNRPPQVDAGASFKLLPGGNAILAGIVDDDGWPNHNLQATWSQKSGPGAVTFDDVTDPHSLVTLAAAGDYVLRLAAHDGELGAFDDVLVTVGNNTAPAVSAGGDQSITVGGSVLLIGEVEDDGLPGDELTVSWAQLDGPGTVTFATPGQLRTLATFAGLGVYTMELEVSDGELSASDAISIEVTEPPVIALESPNGGEIWVVGATHYIDWTALRVSDVTLSLSTDGGDSWETIVPSVTLESPSWGHQPVVVPDQVSDQCLVAISAYIGAGSRVVSAAPFMIARARTVDSHKGDADSGCQASPEAPWGWLVGLALLAKFWRRRR